MIYPRLALLTAIRDFDLDIPDTALHRAAREQAEADAAAEWIELAREPWVDGEVTDWLEEN